MALIDCPDCGTQVSDMAAACPNCARPIAKNTPVQPNPAPVATPPPVAPVASGGVLGWLKWVGGGVLAAVVIGAIIPDNTIKIEKLSSWDPLIGIPTVTAEMVNTGNSMRINYWVKKRGSETKHCRGSTLFATNERRTLKFNCNALKGYNGTFTLEWAPAT